MCLSQRWVRQEIVWSSLSSKGTDTPTVVVIARVPLIVADVLLMYITWSKLDGWNVLSTSTTQQLSKRLSLSDVLFRGGEFP